VGFHENYALIEHYDVDDTLTHTTAAIRRPKLILVKITP